MLRYWCCTASVLARTTDRIQIVHGANQLREIPDHVEGLRELPSMSAAQETRPSRVDDARLIRAAQQGDVAAFEQLVQKYDRAVLRLAIHLTGSEDDGQDIYQEAFLRAYIHLARFRFECSFYTWIYRIAANLCLDHLRRKAASRRRCCAIGVAPLRCLPEQLIAYRSCLEQINFARYPLT